MAPRRRRIAVITFLAAIVLVFMVIDQLVTCAPGRRANEARGMATDEALGATLEPLDRGTAGALGLASDTRGLVVTSLSSAGPAAVAGVRAGDVIERIGSVPVRSVDDISAAIGDKPHDLTLTLNRHRHYAIVRIRTWSARRRRGAD